jgi:hypothetical protein
MCAREHYCNFIKFTKNSSKCNNYVLDIDILGEDVDAVQKEMNSILTAFNDDWEMVHDLKRAHQRSYIEYVRTRHMFSRIL